MKKAQKPFTVHFVCRGNTYRSRLAAAYFAELSGERFVVTSSGINSARATVKTAEKYTKATAKAHKLTHGIDALKTQTTDALLQTADVIVFMNKDVYDESLRSYHFDPRKCIVWHVRDITPVQKQRILAADSEQALVEGVADTFALIQKNCSELYEYLTHTAWVDVVDADNQMTGLRLPMGWACDRGLWHRGVHVVVQTTDGKFVVGKRAKSIVFAPGMLEISLGGGIDSGELPLQAAQRETHEELGIFVAEKHFNPLFLYRVNTFHPHYQKRTRGHVYVYALKLPIHSSQLKPQASEVAELRLLSRSQVKSLLRTHRMKNFGRLMWRHKFYNKAIAYADQA